MKSIATPKPSLHHLVSPFPCPYVCESRMRRQEQSEAIHEYFKTWCHAVPRATIFLAFFIGCLFYSAAAMSAEEKVYRTGIKAIPRYFSVAPGGEKLVFDTSKPFGGMRLFDMASGKIQEIPVEPEHVWEMGSWSADGKRLVAVSTGWKNRQYNRNDMKITLVDPRDWSWQAISPTGQNVKIRPFFSPDGTRVYYFRGEARSTGATAASKYDLYSINLANRKEEKLTDDGFYQVEAGDVSADGRTIYFSKIGGRPMSLEGREDRDGFIYNTLIVTLDLQTREMRPTRDFDKARFIETVRPRLDASGRVYFKGITRPIGGAFVYSIFRRGQDNQLPQRLADFSIGGSFDIARHTGDIFLFDTRDGEIIFRRIAVNAND